jgi:hypothetical protein
LLRIIGFWRQGKLAFSDNDCARNVAASLIKTVQKTGATPTMFTITVAFLCGMAVAETPTVTPRSTGDDWEASSSAFKISDDPLQKSLFEGNPDAFAKMLSQLSPAMAATLGYKTYKISFTSKAELEESLHKGGFTRTTSKNIASVAKHRWFKPGVVAITIYETYLQVEPIFDRSAAVIPISGDSHISALRWRRGAAIAAVLCVVLYCFLREKGIIFRRD